VGRLIAVAATVKYVLDTIRNEGVTALEDIGGKFDKAFEDARMQLFAYQVEQATGGLDAFGQSAEGAAGSVEEFGDAAGATAEEIEAFIDAARKYDEEMAKIEQRFLDRMDDISNQFRQRRADLETDFLRDLRDIDAEASVDRLEAIRDYQVEEIRLREDHALEVRQLEERYLLDLEDAVRDRDARQVLNLQRRFNLEKKQREEDYNLSQKRLRENFVLELQEIEFQRQRRRQERFVAYQEELADLEMQEERKRQAAWLARDRQERDLLERIKNRLEALQEGADGEFAIQQELLDNLVEALNTTYGEDGPWVLYHKAAVETAQNAATAIHEAQGQIIDSLRQTDSAIRAHVRFQEEAANRINQAWSARYTGLAGQAVNLYGSTARQRGGTVFATSPTNIMAGEGRPERVDITPLSAGTGEPSAGFRGGGGGRIAIDLNVDASELLMVEVADQTMNEIADVMVNLNKRGAQGGRIGR
jgi:methyl-accepting chemotaxis protein